jgi:hypothetical protein
VHVLMGTKIGHAKQNNGRFMGSVPSGRFATYGWPRDATINDCPRSEVSTSEGEILTIARHRTPRFRATSQNSSEFPIQKRCWWPMRSELLRVYCTDDTGS